jgi:Family of unknown function (DUF6572)
VSQARAGKPDASFDPSKVDLVSISPDGSTVNLYIVADQPLTGSDVQLRSLQEKIHNYVGYVRDGQMSRELPETSGLAWRIVIDSQGGPPDARTSQVVSTIAEAVRRYGGDLAVQESGLAQ